MTHRTTSLLAQTLALALALPLLGCDDARRNAYMLSHEVAAEYGYDSNPLADDGYDWWWHSFVARSQTTGEQQAFFIEYYVINPDLGGPEPILGQLPENQAAGVRPSYAMIKAGTWKKNASAEINNFYGIDAFSASIEMMDVRIGQNLATEDRVVGSVAVTEQDAASRPELMSDAGEMSWDLSVEKPLSYSVGYAASDVAVGLDAFQMYWHVNGMRALFSGTVTYNGEVFDVTPEESYGYQDKNWGNDYTNPWVWLNCNNFVRAGTGEPAPEVSLVVGGGVPTAFGIPLGKKVLVAFSTGDAFHEYNFTKELQRQRFEVTETADALRWQVDAADAQSRVVIDFSSPKSKMLKVRYENPSGELNHLDLWNGGYAAGTVELYKRVWFWWKLVDRFEGSFGGSEYGEH